MKKSIIILLTFIVCGSVTALDFPDTPIQAQLQAERYATAGDEFDDLNKTDKKKDVYTNKVDQSRKKNLSVFRAGLYSAILPGLGQRYVGAAGKAKYFFGVEAAGWLGFAAFQIYGGWKRDDMENFATVNAGANLTGKTDEFLDMVGFYASIDEYNSFGRAFDPERAYYFNDDTYHWLWQSDSDREAYRSLKNGMRESYRRANFMIGLVVLNRIISIIDAVRDARRSHRVIDGFSSEEWTRYDLKIDPFSLHHQIQFTIYTGL